MSQPLADNSSTTRGMLDDRKTLQATKRRVNNKKFQPAQVGIGRINEAAWWRQIQCD